MPEENKEHHFPRDIPGQVLSATKQSVILGDNGEIIQYEDLDNKFVSSARSTNKGINFIVIVFSTNSCIVYTEK